MIDRFAKTRINRLVNEFQVRLRATGRLLIATNDVLRRNKNT
jgi:hypothetical protein